MMIAVQHQESYIMIREIPFEGQESVCGFNNSNVFPMQMVCVNNAEGTPDSDIEVTIDINYMQINRAAQLKNRIQRDE